MSTMEKLKEMLVRELNIDGVDPKSIGDDEPLFGEGLGLDSLDAVELVVQVQKHFGVEIKDMEEGRAAFASIRTLAAYIEERSAG